MRGLARRRWLLSVIALGGLLLAVVWTSALALGESRGAAWCYDGNRWLGYAEGIPGSTAEEDFTACLRRSAERDEVLRFDAQMTPGGVLIDVGEASLFWGRGGLKVLDVTLNAWDDRVEFKDSCDRKIIVSSGIPTKTAEGSPCVGERIEIDSRDLTAVDFTIFVINRQFIIDGPDGWYHIRLQGHGSSQEDGRSGEVTLVGQSGVWAKTRYIAWHLVHDPVAGTLADRQQWRVYDWGAHVNSRRYEELIPLQFDRAWHYQFPDYDAYIREAQDWVDAILYDLYGNEAEPIELKRLSTLTGGGLVGGGLAVGRTIYLGSFSTYVILHEVAHALADAEQSHDRNFAATWLMLWDRYVPNFDMERALELAKQYSVEIGTAPEVRPVSGRTRAVRQLTAKEPPPLPSDNTQIEPEELLLKVVLELGRTYAYQDNMIVATSKTMPSCTVEESHSDDVTYLLKHGPETEFSVNLERQWNGLAFGGYSNAKTGEIGTTVIGTPTAAGRVLVRVTTRCPGGYAQEPRFVGYSEIIVVDPAAEED